MKHTRGRSEAEAKQITWPKTTTLPATKVRAQFFKILQATERPGSQFTITVEGEPKVVMMPVADFEGWMETLEIISDSRLVKEIRDGLKDKKRYTLAQIKKDLGTL